jgi:hypothetical protein
MLVVTRDGQKMGDRDKTLTAYCGLFCGDCIRYKSKAADLALDLLNELKRVHFDNYATVKRSSVKAFEHFGEMTKAMEAINHLKCDTPCRLGGDGCDKPCEIIKCVHLKGLDGCWKCGEFEKCDKLDFLKPFHGNGPQKNLKKIKKYGLDNWATHREKIYPWL